MTRRDRLMATIQGKTVDRPAVSFYELNGLDEDPQDPDPFNIYNDPSWRALIELTAEKTDRMVLRQVPMKKSGEDFDRTRDNQMVGIPYNPLSDYIHTESWLNQQGSRMTRHTIRIKQKILSSTTRQDPDVNTIWTVEPFLKNVEDIKTLLDLPVIEDIGEPDVTGIFETEKLLGDSGIVLIDTPDPLCLAAELFDMQTYLMIAMQEQKLFQSLLNWFSIYLQAKTESVARKLPGRLWRIYGPEFAGSPYLPPALFREYVVKFDTAMVKTIHQYGGFCRLHAHGKLKDILDDIVSTGCMGLDPIEPPPQGDVDLSFVRKNYGRELVLFGNLEASDIENLAVEEMEAKTLKALEEGTAGEGRGFVLMPSSCPYGRKLSTKTLNNYEKIIEVIEKHSP